MTVLSDPRPMKSRRHQLDLRVSTCKICRYGIFNGQDKVWSRYPLGLVHLRCVMSGE
jgi:hypothetical protein